MTVLLTEMNCLFFSPVVVILNARLYQIILTAIKGGTGMGD